MSGKVMVLLVSTFCMGVFAGAYFYVSVFAPSYNDVLKGRGVSADSFLIEGQMYGSCEEDATCASFQLVDGREFSYMPYEDAAIVEGTLSASYKRVLTSSLTAEVLEQQAKRSAERNCSSRSGGVDYTYVVTKDRQEYILDSCTTLLSNNIELQQMLFEVWFAFEHEDAQPSETPVSDLQLQNVADLFFERFHKGVE
jgi:hypothetical protein